MRLRPLAYFVRYKFRIVTGVAILILALGTSVFFEVHGREVEGLSRVLDALYRTIQTFGLNFDLPVDASGNPVEMNWQIQASRYGAVVFTFITIFSLISHRLMERLLIAAQSRCARRHVLIGFGRVNRAIAHALVARPDAQGLRLSTYVAITAIDRSVSAEDRRAAAEIGVLLIEGDSDDPEVRKRLRLKHAEKIFIGLGADERNIAMAGTISREIGKLQRQVAILAHVSDLRLGQDLIEAPDLAAALENRFQCFSAESLRARDFVARARLVRRAQELGQLRVHLVIVGEGGLAEAIMVEALLSSHAADLKPPKVTFLLTDLKGFRASLVARYPRLFDDTIKALEVAGAACCEGAPAIDFRSIDVETVELAQLQLRDPDAPTDWVFCSQDGKRNLGSALRLEIALLQGDGPTSRLFAYLEDTGATRNFQDRSTCLGLLQPLPNLVDVLRASEVLAQDPDWLAKRMHDAYRQPMDRLKREPEASSLHSAFDQHWDMLPENLKESNRRLVRRLSGKLCALGLDWRGQGSGCLPALLGEWRDEGNVPWSTLKGLALPGLDRALQDTPLVEHIQWVYDRAVSGWRQGDPGEDGQPQRDNRRRWHTDFLPFEALPDDKKKNDLTPLSAILQEIFKAGKDRTKWKGPRLVPAFPHKVAHFHLGDADTFPNCDVRDATELYLTIGPSFTSQGVKSLEAIIDTWLRADCATRLRLDLEAPLVLPVMREPVLGDGIGVISGDYRAWPVSKILRSIPAEVEVDIVRR